MSRRGSTSFYPGGKRARVKRAPLPKVLDLPPRNADQPLKGAEIVAINNAWTEKRAERRKRQRADRAELEARRRTASQPIDVNDADLLKLWQQGETALLQAVMKNVVRGMVRELRTGGQVWSKVKGKPCCLIAPRALDQSDADMLFSVGFAAARHAIGPQGFNGRGNLRRYARHQVWFAFSHHFEDSQSDFTAGVSDLPDEFRRTRAESLHGPAVDARGDPHAYESGASSAATALDNLTAEAQPWHEDDNDRMRRIFEGTDPARQSTYYGMSRKRLDETLRAAITKIRDREHRVILLFLFERGYDFSNRTAFLLQEYAMERDLTLPTVRERRGRALAALRDKLVREWPEWSEHFHTRPERRLYT